MELVETKTYAFEISTTEREQLMDIIEKLRRISREIDEVLGNDYPIEVDCDTYTAEDLWRAKTLLEGIVYDNYRI